MSIFQTASGPTASISLLQDAMESMTLHEHQRRCRTARANSEKRTTYASRARRCQKSGDDEDETCNSDPCKSWVPFLIEWDGLGRWAASIPEFWFVPCYRSRASPEPKGWLEAVDRSKLTTNRFQCMGNKLPVAAPPVGSLACRFRICITGGSSRRDGPALHVVVLHRRAS